ncbi:translation initiation factor IF-5A [Candidatus Bathyarchaeota archaeon]|nr:MAG: translation initiation factor IF-5A [Candidatus Hecatellales archaeon ex4484_218]RJX16353.1 MAG: translation initiation factor IF-5A [Candidatus Bathyarchaeota archaeon]
MSKPVDVGSIKEGQYIIIDNEPCKVVEYEKSKPGKHGSAKARIVAIGVFDNVKRSIVSPVDSKIEVPIIEKRAGQIISVNPTTIQLMDLETYEIFETNIPVEEEIKSKISSGAEVEYWKILGRVKIVRVKG